MNKIILTNIHNVSNSYYFNDGIRKVNIDVDYEADCDFVVPSEGFHLSVLVSTKNNKILAIDICSSIDIYTDYLEFIDDEKFFYMKKIVTDHLSYLRENNLETKDYD